MDSPAQCHAALQTSDIIAMIAEQIYVSRQHYYRMTLGRAMQVNHQFADVIRPVLWRRLPDLSPLWCLLVPREPPREVVAPIPTSTSIYSIRCCGLPTALVIITLSESLSLCCEDRSSCFDARFCRFSEIVSTRTPYFGRASSRARSMHAK